MVSTRRKSYQPPAAAASSASPGTAPRQRHSSLTSSPAAAPPPAAGPRRRRAASLTALEAGAAAAEARQARGHRTKALLERYRSEAAGALADVAEEAESPAAVETGSVRSKSVRAELVSDAAAKAAEDGDGGVVDAAADVVGVVASDTAAEAGTESTMETAEEAAVETVGETAEEATMEVDKGKDAVVSSSTAQSDAARAARRLAAAQRVLASVTETAAPAATAEPQPPAALTRVRPAPVPRGMAKSGRFWKSVRSRASKVVVRDPVSYEIRMQKRQQQRMVKDLENQLKDERKQKLEELRKRREYNVKKTAENALKAEVYQVVKNPNKIKRMKKKQLRLLQKRDTTVVGKSVLDE